VSRATTWRLVGADGSTAASARRGALGGHRRSRIYGRLDCRTALAAIRRGGYVEHRVFFADERTAIAAGYRPCAVCLPEQYGEWRGRTGPPPTRVEPLSQPTGKVPFEAVVAEHGAVVLRVCRAVVGDPDADDAWSETFLAAMRTYPDLPADANVAAWLVTIAHRKAIDVTRAAGRRATPVAQVPERPSGAGAVPSALDEDLADALRALPEKQRHAIAYHYLAGLPYREVADIVGGTADAARRAAADGMATLRRTYAVGDGTESSR
jgi:RNA polymerase sigma factor (sigma-70 family)